jgi:hypothetical protein
MLCSCYTSIYIEIVGYDQIDGFGKKEVRSFLSFFLSFFLSLFVSFFVCFFLITNLTGTEGRFRRYTKF